MSGSNCCIFTCIQISQEADHASASASKQPARPPQASRPSAGAPGEVGPALTLTHTRTRTRTDTRSARRFPSFSPFLYLPPRSLSPSRSQNEAPGRAEGGAAPTGPAPLPARQEEEGGSQAGREDC